MKKNSWRLSSDLIAFFSNDLVYLCSPEKKSYRSAILKKIYGNTQSPKEVNIENNQFNLKINKDFRVFIKCGEFPNPNHFYEVKNFSKVSDYSDIPDIGSIISQVNGIDHGVYPDNIIFEAAFSEEKPDEVMFINDSMPEYKEAFQEMKRRLNCSLYKKTKKWIPGHRYDSLSETYYYLGEFLSRRKEPYNSSFIKDPSDMQTVYLVTKDIDDSFGKISDIFKTKIFGNENDNILVLDKLPSCVDSGEVLENDVTNIQDYWDNLVENSYNKYKNTNKFGLVTFDNQKYIFDIFCYQSVGKLDYNISELTKAKIEDVIKTEMTNIKVSSKSDKSNLLNEYTTKIIDGNIDRVNYYTELFNVLQIDKKIIENIDKLDVDSLLLNLNSYVKYGEIHRYFKNNSKVLISKQRINSTSYKLDVITIDELLSGFDDLKSVVIDIINNARNNYGIGVSQMSDINVGTKKCPKVYTTISMNILDIINYYNGIDNIPEKVKFEILNKKFWGLELTIDKDRELK